MKDRAAVIRILETQRYYYHYIVRDLESHYLLLFSLKPKKYKYDNFWGYVNENEEGVKPAMLIENTDITEINWTNRSAIEIDKWLEEQEAANEVE